MSATVSNGNRVKVFIGEDRSQLANFAPFTGSASVTVSVAARDLKECLLLQVAPDARLADPMRVLIRDHLEDVAYNRIPVIQKPFRGHDLLRFVREQLEGASS